MTVRDLLSELITQLIWNDAFADTNAFEERPLPNGTVLINLEGRAKTAASRLAE